MHLSYAEARSECTFNVLFYLSSFYYRIDCCFDNDVFDDCYKCWIGDVDESKEICDLDCEYADGNTIGHEDPLHCECADEFYGECCQYGNDLPHVSTINF